MSLIPPLPNTIAHASQQAFTALTALSGDAPSPAESEELHRTARKYSDELERLEIWISEHHVRAGTLDHRLREAGPLRKRVMSLLAELSEYCASAVPNAGTGTFDEQYSSPEISPTSPVGSKSLSALQLQISDDQSVESASLSLDTNFTLPDSLPDSPLTHIHDAVTLLFELGPSLLDPTPHDRFELSNHPGAAHHDISHVRAKFPDAAEDLTDRLGRANWERRQYLRKLQLDLEGPCVAPRLDLSGPAPPEDQLAMSGAASESDKSDPSDDDSDEMTQTRPFGESTISDRGSSLPGSRTNLSDFRFSTDETQLTELTEPSKGITQAESPRKVGTRFKLPAPPSPNEDLTGEAFLCPFCAHTVLDMKSPSEWKKHVIYDLEPYMCTHKDCLLSAKTYRSKKSWWQHETERHRVQHAWVCNPCERKQHPAVFDTPASFEEHLTTIHPTLKPTQLSAVRDMCAKDVGKRPPSDECPLCRESIAGTSNLDAKAFERLVKKHVSDHLEQLAFFVALPAGQTILREDESEFQDDSDSGDGLQSEIWSIVSKDTHISKQELRIANVKAFIADQQSAADEPGILPVPRPESSQNRRSKLAAQAWQTTQDASTATLSFPIFVQMPPPSEHFYSRETLLANVGKALRSPGLICIVHGIGGVGKTLAAIQYGFNHKEQYDAIFWLQADTAPGLADSYLQMVTALGIASSPEDHHQVIEKGRNWLQDTDKRWLLVFDNALKWEDISKYLPNALRKTRGSVLITTHLENILPRADNVTKIHIEPLDQQAGSEMLLKYLGRDVRTDPERHLAREISAFVGGLPVAIAHVAGYVSFSQYNLEELIETFREWRKRTGVATDEADDLPATFREDSFSYDGTLAMVWEVTLRELTQDACDVLDILAYLNCAAVPQKMLWGMHEDPSLQFLDMREKIRMRRINESLIKRRLVVDSDGGFSMHRSLQRGIRQKLSQDKGKQQRVFNQAVALVREAFPRSNPLQQPTPEKWSEYQKLLPHLHALRDVYHASNSQIKGSIDFAQLLLDAGMDQFEQGITQEGLLLLNTSEKVLDASAESSFEVQQVMRADIHAMIAIMYDDTGIEKRQEALQRRELALEIRKRTFEEAETRSRKSEILVFNSWMEYAISLLHYHRYEEAEPIIEKCLAKFQEWGTEEEIPFEYAKYYNKIALVKMYKGSFDEAIRLGTRGVQLMEKTGYHVFSSRLKFDLACIMVQNGELDRALQEHRTIHDQRMKLVGPTNQLSLHSMYAIGAIYELKGDLVEAESWFRKVLDQRRTFSSWPEEAFARAQFHLARVLSAQGRTEDLETASELRNSAIAVLDRLLPMDFPRELEDVTDQAILFDHMLPISPGGPRFTGRGLLERFMRHTDTA